LSFKDVENIEKIDKALGYNRYTDEERA